MKQGTTVALALAAQTLVAAPIFYPAKGQSAATQDKDRYECHDWARGQSGYDPTQAALQPAPAGEPGTTAAAKSGATGMAVGAMGGAALAELTHHDAGRGAAVGVVSGAVLQRAKQQSAQSKEAQQAQAAQQQALQQAAARNQQRATYERALGACMEGRGYTVR